MRSGMGRARRPYVPQYPNAIQKSAPMLRDQADEGARTTPFHTSYTERRLSDHSKMIDAMFILRPSLLSRAHMQTLLG